MDEELRLSWRCPRKRSLGVRSRYRILKSLEQERQPVLRHAVIRAVEVRTLPCGRALGENIAAVILKSANLLKFFPKW